MHTVKKFLRLVQCVFSCFVDVRVLTDAARGTQTFISMFSPGVYADPLCVPATPFMRALLYATLYA